MNTSDLSPDSPNNEISNSDEDKHSKFKLLSPLFTNLYQNKVVYHERFTSIITLENMELTPNFFKATAKQYYIIELGSIRRKRPLPERWEVGANWNYLSYSNNCLSAYSSWLMWTDPELVKKIEQLVRNGEYQEASKLLIY